MSRAEILTQAREAFRLGHLDQADALYRELLAGEPEDATAHHMLGLIAHQRGDLAPSCPAMPPLHVTVSDMVADALIADRFEQPIEQR